MRYLCIKVNTHEAKTKLSQLLMKVEKTGEPVIICRNGVPIATLNSWKKSMHDPFKQHPVLKKVIINEDPTLPLDNDEWRRK